MSNCRGFIDVTVRLICRPGQKQRYLYNGHKRTHSIKFQSVAAPNGLVANLYRSIEGKRHDSAMLAEFRLLDQMQLHCNDANGYPFCVYENAAYPLRAHLQKPFQGARLNDQQKEFNTAMSSVRTSVEWLFGDVINYFKFMDFKKKIENRSKSCWKNVRSLRYFAKCTHNFVWEHNLKLFSKRTSKFKRVFFVVYFMFC